MGQPGAAQFATAVLLLNHRHRKVMPSSWPALLRNCADGLSAQPSTGRATRTLTWAGANAAGAGAATIFYTSAAPSTRRRATCASSRGAPKDAARLRSLARRPSGRRAYYGLPLQRRRRVRRALLRQQPASPWVLGTRQCGASSAAPHFSAAAIEKLDEKPVLFFRTSLKTGVVGDIRTVRSMRGSAACFASGPPAHFVEARASKTPQTRTPAVNIG